MDEILEFILEFILEAAIEGIKSKKVPKVIKIILFGIIITVFLGLILLFVYLSFILDSGALSKFILFGLALLTAVFLMKFIMGMIERERERE